MKKELNRMLIGDLTVILQLRESDDEQFLIVGAQCGMTQCETSLTMHPSPDHTAESLDRDIATSAKKVAGEAAARERARLLREALFQS